MNPNKISYNFIFALCKKNNGIGNNGILPWTNLKEDMKYFKDTTINNIVIMGRKTWESLPEKHKPLQNRINIIISKTMKRDDIREYKDTYLATSPGMALIKAKLLNPESRIFVIGGAEIYNLYLEQFKENLMNIYVTEVYNTYECDKVINYGDIKETFKLIHVSQFCEDKGVHYRFLKYTTRLSSIIEWVNEEELMYLDTLEEIIINGEKRDNRTGINTLSKFGVSFTFDLTDTFPVLTTKRMYLRGIFEELMFYLSGSTNNKVLTDKNVNIWNDNTSRDFLDKRGLNHYIEGDMGETYGFNFRHFGAEYVGCDRDYSGCGYDQLENAIHLIKNDPTSRRIIINLWNPSTLHKASLPSCLYCYQFNVDIINKRLDVLLIMRSSDFFLANNWNVCTGAFLVHLICNLEGIDLTPGNLHMVCGDTHVYENHIEAANELLTRKPKPFPKLWVKHKKQKITDFTYDDIELLDYYPYKNIPVKMAI